MHKIDFNFAHPDGDSTIYGTLAAIREDSFKLETVDFKSGDVFLDIGCNVGALSCVVAATFPFVNVVGFDASPLAIKYARQNAINNKLSNLSFFNKAIGPIPKKKVKFFSDSINVSTLIEQKYDSENRADGYSADMIRLVDIMDSPLLGIERIKYLKVDIEGGEFELFNDLFLNYPNLLNRIEYIHLEIHKIVGYDYEKLGTNIKNYFGNRSLLDMVI